MLNFQQLLPRITTTTTTTIMIIIRISLQDPIQILGFSLFYPIPAMPSFHSTPFQFTSSFYVHYTFLSFLRFPY